MVGNCILSLDTAGALFSPEEEKLKTIRILPTYLRVLRGSVVKCLTRNPGVLDLSCTGSSRFFTWEYPWALRAPA